MESENLQNTFRIVFVFKKSQLFDVATGLCLGTLMLRLPVDSPLSAASGIIMSSSHSSVLWKQELTFFGPTIKVLVSTRHLTQRATWTRSKDTLLLQRNWEGAPPLVKGLGHGGGQGDLEVFLMWRGVAQHLVWVRF